MWIVRLALRRPYTFTVVSILVAILGFLSVLPGTPMSMSTDIFPEIDIPVVSVIWSYTGISPDDMEKRIITIAERAMTTTVNGIEHMESQSMNGVGVIKIYFQPNVKIESAVAEVTSIQQTILRVLPPNITPPLILRFSASSVPILQLAIKSETQPEQVLYDQATNFIRQPLATVQGASIPLPYGGKPRQIMVDLDPKALYAKGLSPTDVVNALNAQNLILPAGTAKFGEQEYLVKLNSSPDVVSAFNDLPIRAVNGSVVYMRDVAQIHDGYAVQQNIVRQDGVRSALLSVLKGGGASTLDIVKRVKTRLEQVRAGLVAGLEVKELFDQSVFVKAAISGVVKEAAIAACLTATMILIFLGSWRSTLIIAASIPLSILISLLLLSALGYTLNVMTLGGLSLAVGILVDDATVELENIHRNLGLEEEKPLTKAILDGAQQIATPAFVSTLSICIVFVSVLFLNGPAKFLFVPLALAVVFAMMASYFLSRTLVPVMVHFLLGPEVPLYREEAEHEREHKEGNEGARDGKKPADGKEEKRKERPENGQSQQKPAKKDFIWRIHEKFNERFDRFRARYRGALEWSLDHRGLVLGCFGVFVGLSLCLTFFVGRDFFPRVDAGQFRLHVRTASGTRIEEAERVFGQVENYIRQIVPKEELKLILDNIGLPVGGVNLAFSDSATIGSSDGEILVALEEGHKTPTPAIVKRLRRELPAQFPGVTFYFQPADIVSQILNFGLPAPIDVQVTGPGRNAPQNYEIAKQLADKVAQVPGAVDVNIHQVLDAPQIDVNLDRSRAQLLGLSANDVANSLLISLSSSGQTARNYWVNPQNGVNYLVAVQTRQYEVDSLNALNNTPVIPASGGSGNGAANPPQPQLLVNLAHTQRSVSPVVINHYNIQPAYDIYADAQDRDLGGVASEIDKIVASYQPKEGWIKSLGRKFLPEKILGKPPQSKLPGGSEITVRGQVQSMNHAFMRLGFGVLFAIVLVYLLMVVNFQSWLDPLIIITALPGALSGILWMLFATSTTFSVPSLMGTIMCIGVATANSILLITFANDQRLEGADAFTAALDAGTTRLRPVLMTALAMILGMIPMSLGLGEGGEQNAPLGRAVIGGLLVATATTLFVVPLFYSIMRKKDLVPVSDEDAELLFAEDEPERQMAESMHRRDDHNGQRDSKNGQNGHDDERRAHDGNGEREVEDDRQRTEKKPAPKESQRR